MLLMVTKDTRINLRLTPAFRAELETLAEYHGLTLSSYVHSILVKGVRSERERLMDSGQVLQARNLASVVAKIEPAHGMTKDQIRRELITDQRMQKIPVLKRKAK